MKIKSFMYAPIPFALMVFLCSIIPITCVRDLAQGGSGTEVGNPTVTGKIVDESGTGAANTLINLYPDDFNPTRGVGVKSAITDAHGSYSLQNVDSGTYNIIAVGQTNRMKAILCNIAVGKDSVALASAVLRRPSTIKLTVPDTLGSRQGFVYIPGTNISAWHSGAAQFVLLDSVPAGLVPPVYFSDENNTAGVQLTKDSITVGKADTVYIAYSAWKFSKTLSLNTTASGADVAGIVTNFPLLIRLNSANFPFGQAKSDGGDLRFTKTNGMPLPFEIERWDAGARQAEVWVKIDTVYGNDSTHFFIMYWGDSAVTSASNGEAVFDTTNGFQGVWHLNGPGNVNASDATIHHYNGTPTDTAPQSISGIIGTALQFDGNVNGLVMNNTAHSPLNFSRPGTYTFSAWVSVDTVYDADEFIAGKGYDQYSLRVKGSLSYPSSLFSLNEYVDAPIYGTEMRIAPVVIQQWKYIVGIRDTNNSYLFIDGRCVDSSGTIFYSKGNVQDSTKFSIGRCAAPYTAPANSNTYLAFKGKIDEVRIANIACSADLVKLSYMNQKQQDMLVKW